MPPLLRSALRRALPLVGLLGLALAGCSDPTAPPAPSGPAPTAGSTTAAAPATPEQAGGVSAGTSRAGSDGLTVRYLDKGTVKTVHVEDFPR